MRVVSYYNTREAGDKQHTRLDGVPPRGIYTPIWFRCNGNTALTPHSEQACEEALQMKSETRIKLLADTAWLGIVTDRPVALKNITGSVVDLYCL